MNSYKIRYIPATQESLGVAGDQKSRVLRASVVPTHIVRYVYYGFIFSLPFESTDVDIGGLPLARMLGFLLIGVTIAAALLQKRRFRLQPPPLAFWCFAAYLLIYAALGLNMIVGSGPEARLTDSVIQGIKTLVQLLVFFWLSYNLLQYERITKGTLLTLAVSSTFVAVLQSLGMTGDIRIQDQETAFDANANAVAEILSLGLLIILGLAYGRGKTDLKSRLLFWTCSAVLVVSIVITGSRGGLIALTAALVVFFLKGKSLKSKLKIGTIVVLAVGVLGWLSYEIQAVRERWERTYYLGDTSGRDAIFSAAWEMFLEKPLIGWGPADNTSELGSRLGLRVARDPHNTYLWLLTETGLLGALPFFAGLLLCWCAAWRARDGIQGALPMSLMLFILTIGMKGTNFNDKLYWVVLAYTLASGTYIAVSSGVHLQASLAGNLRSQASTV